MKKEKREARRLAREEYVKEQEQKEQDEYWLEREIENEVRNMNSVKKADITELKALSNPPVIVKQVLEAAIILLDPAVRAADLTWKNIKSYLADPAFLTKMKIFDKDNVAKHTMKRLGKITLTATLNLLMKLLVRRVKLR